jgi:hypothetical protein
VIPFKGVAGLFRNLQVTSQTKAKRRYNARYNIHAWVRCNHELSTRRQLIRVFIRSVQKELAAERRAVKDFILHDPLLSRFIGDVFLFEDIPAGDRKPDDIYLGEVEQRDNYMLSHKGLMRWKGLKVLGAGLALLATFLLGPVNIHAWVR